MEPPTWSEGKIEEMAEMEHGRWNIERFRDGWRPGPRDDASKLHDCLVAWNDLPGGKTGVQEYDRRAVRAFPKILAKAELEVLPPADSPSSTGTDSKASP